MSNPKTQPMGYTMIEMTAVLLMIGILSAFAFPSLLNLNNSLSNSVSSLKGFVTLARSKAIGSSQVYRLRPIIPTAGSRAKSFILERIRYENEASGQKVVLVSERGCREDDPTKWQAEYQFQYDLPNNLEIVNEFPGTQFNGEALNNSNYLNWAVCFNQRGMVDRTVQFVIKDTRLDNYAVKSQMEITGAGGIIYRNYTKDNNLTGNNGQEFKSN